MRPTAERLRAVLRLVTFPAAKWQIVTAAEAYGADAETRAQLWGLREGTYRDLREVVSAVDGAADPDSR